MSSNYIRYEYKLTDLLSKGLFEQTDLNMSLVLNSQIKRHTRGLGIQLRVTVLA
jgi:hypothetical protein